MVSKTKLLQQNSRVGKGNSEFSSVNLGDTDDIQRMDDDSEEKEEEEPVNDTNSVDTQVVVDEVAETKTMSRKEKAREERDKEMRLIVLVWLFLEKFVEIAVVFLLTLLAIKWAPLYYFLEDIFWPIVVFAAFFMTVLIVLYRIRWFRRSPGCFVYKLIYLHFLIAVFFVLAIHFPIALPFLSSYFALVAAGTVGATYILFAFVSVTHKHFCKVDAKGCALWLYGFVMPVTVLVASQPVYFVGGIGNYSDYSDYIVNIVAGVLTSLPFIYETLFIYHRFVNSNSLEEFVNTKGLLPGFVTSSYGKSPELDDEAGEGKKQFFQFRI